MGQNAIKLFKINVLFEILANLKSALKNHKKVVDKNVPLNRLVFKAQKWLIEPVLGSPLNDFRDQKTVFYICPHHSIFPSEPARKCSRARAGS